MSDLDAAIRGKVAADDAREADEIYWDAYRDAVLAALDLHTPDSWGEDERPHCTECSGNGGVRIWAPCETVRVIAEKLGVEVPRG